MKAIIMAAGKGTRMLPLTEDIPKVLVEVNGKPFLYYVIKNLEKAGFSDIRIIVGYKKEKIKEFLKEYNLKGELMDQKEQLGTGHAVMQLEGVVISENFVLLGGDNLWDVDSLKDIAKDDDLNYICGIEVEDTSKYGVLVVEGDKLVRVAEKSKESLGNLINTGLYKFTPEIFEALKIIEKSERGEFELTAAVSILAKEGKVKVIKAKWWKDLGCVDDIKPVGEFLEKNL